MKYSCYYIICFGCLTGLTMHFYIIFGTNLLTGGSARIAVFFCLFQYIEGKEYQTESKRKETFGSDIFGRNAIQETWRDVKKQSRRPRGCRARPLPRGPLVAPLTDFFRLCILIYLENIREHHEKLFPPPKPFASVRSHLGAFVGAPLEGESTTNGLSIITKASPMSCE